MRWLLGVLVVFLVGYAMTGLVEVRRGERAVVRRFGRVLDYKPEPGLWIGLPWGIDRVDRVEVDTIRTVDVGISEDLGPIEEAMPAGQLLTGDHNLVNLRVVLQYKVRPEEVASFVMQGQRVPEVLTRAVESVAADWVAGRPVDEVLLLGQLALSDELAAGVRAVIEPYQLGIAVLDARVTRVAPPDEVKDAFDGVLRAQTQMATLRYQAEQEAASRLVTVRGESYRIGQTARAYAHSKRVLARQDAQRFLNRLRQYRLAGTQNAEYLRQLWQEERGRLFNKMRENGQLDLLDHHLSGGGLDLLTAPQVPQRR